MKYLFFIFFPFFITTCCPPESNSIRVMNFNIRYDTETDGVNKWDNRKSFVLKVIQDFNPDLLGTQEAMKSQVDYLSSNLTEYHSIGTNNCDCREQYDSLLFVKKTRYKILEERHFWLSTTPHIPFTDDFAKSSPRASLGPRTMSCVEILDKIDNYTLFFCNTHWNGDVLSNEQSADLTKQIFAQYGKKVNILIGDFNEFPFNYNTWPQTPDWIATRQSHAYDTLMSFMIDGFKQLYPNNTQSSGCGWDLTCPIWDNDYRIDWILHNKNVHTQESKILIERRPNGIPVSDHFPVISILEVVNED